MIFFYGVQNDRQNLPDSVLCRIPGAYNIMLTFANCHDKRKSHLKRLKKIIKMRRAK